MIRRLGPDEHELLKELRLAALADAPSAFGTTYEQAAANSDADWRFLLRPDGNPTFVWEDERGTLGMAVAARDRAGTRAIYLVAMWVRPEARGDGVADALVEAVVRWASEQRAPCVRLSVTEGNDRAERLYERHGFERTGRAELRRRDGVVEIEMQRMRSPTAGDDRPCREAVGDQPN